jgi:hypothetical protein
MFVLINGFNGVDIDYEDSDALTNTGPYDGIGFLIALTGGLAGALPPGHNIITHAPQTPYWDPNYYLWASERIVAPYKQIWQKASNHIAWINNQFYNNQGYDDNASIKVMWYNNIAAITGAQKLLMGVLLSGGEGVENLDDMVRNVLPPLEGMYGSNLAVSWVGSLHLIKMAVGLTESGKHSLGRHPCHHRRPRSTRRSYTCATATCRTDRNRLK